MELFPLLSWVQCRQEIKGSRGHSSVYLQYVVPMGKAEPHRSTEWLVNRTGKAGKEVSGLLMILGSQFLQKMLPVQPFTSLISTYLHMVLCIYMKSNPSQEDLTGSHWEVVERG